jgi:hypothetical protein
MKRLALFFDGTWNDPKDRTNVSVLKNLVAPVGTDGRPQLPFYDEGVGTHALDRVSGGAFGVGLSENVQQGYAWLMQNYEAEDEIFIFGFSRGAFTARSLAGVIARCGLLKPGTPLSFKDVYKRYRKGTAATPIYDLKYFGAKPQNAEDEIIRDQTWYGRSFIKMVGVWDTVGSLGLPFGHIPGISSSTLHFHYTRLSRTVEHSYQALALDEYRKPYRPEVWMNFLPEDEDAQKMRADNRFVEQRWFAGAHSDVGGGYPDDQLRQRPLAWMQQKATNCGLAFTTPIKVKGDDDLTVEPHKSYETFLKGFWKILTFGKRYVRPVQPDPVLKDVKNTPGKPKVSGWVHTVNERIDLSVFRRCQLNPGYCPPGLVEWAARKKLDVKQIAANPDNFQQVWSLITTSGIEPPTLPR